MAAILAFGLVNASSASAALPPACDEYPSLPICEPKGEENNPNGGPTGPVATTGGGPSAEHGAASGELPFTGYPLTPLLLLLLALLAAGLTLRAYLYARDRYRARHSTGPKLL